MDDDNRVWTTERLEIVRRLVDEGQTPAEIGARFGKTGRQISTVLSRYKIRRPHGPYVWTPERLVTLRQMAEEKKMTTAQIATEFGVAKHIIRYRLQKENIRTSRTTDKSDHIWRRQRFGKARA